MLFEEQIARRPDMYPWTQDFINAMWQGHWTPNEFSFKGDLHDFKVNLTEQERGVVIRTLSAISQIEIAVKKFWSRLGDNLPHPSITDMGLVMAQIEVVHNKAYEKLLDVLGIHDQFEANLELEAIGSRVKYLRKYLDLQYEDDRKQYIYALILFTLFVENISLFSQFYIILWFNRFKNLLRDTAQQIQYTKNEEMLHAQAGIKLIQTLREEYPELFDADLEQRVLESALEAHNAEVNIVSWIFGFDRYASDEQNEKTEYAPSAEMNRYTVYEYIKNRMKESLAEIGFNYPAFVHQQILKNSLWMDEEVLGNNMTDFFWKRPVEYTKKSTTFSEEDLF